jgi:hypothetical protein
MTMTKRAYHRIRKPIADATVEIHGLKIEVFQCPKCGILKPLDGGFGWRIDESGVKHRQSHCRSCRGSKDEVEYYDVKQPDLGF